MFFSSRACHRLAQEDCEEQFQVEMSQGTASKRDHETFMVCLTL